MLDIGCGTGALAAALAEREHARVWGVDPSEPMLEVARARGIRGLGLKQGVAERVPFRDGWFERAVMCLVVHHVERPAAFAEVHRVLTPHGRLAIATFDHTHFDRHWAASYFLSLAPIDRARFPTCTELEDELRAAGFPTSAPRCSRTPRRSTAIRHCTSCARGTSRRSHSSRLTS